METKKLTQKEAFIKQIENYSNYKKDRFGHYTRTRKDGVELRLKIQATSVRLEKKVIFEADKYSPKRSEWFRLDSQYFSKITITEDNKLKLDRMVISLISV